MLLRADELIRKSTDMERKFTNENVEEFLRRSADELRMRPSATVWKAISSELKWRRRRFGFILATSLLLTTALGYYLINESSGNLNSVTSTVSAQKKSSPVQQPVLPAQQIAVVSAAPKNKAQPQLIAGSSAIALSQNAGISLFAGPTN